MCHDRYRHEREARDAAHRGYLDYEERETYERGRDHWNDDSCAKVFADAYDRELRNVQEEREREEYEQACEQCRAAERAAEERELEQAQYEHDMAQQQEEDYARAQQEQDAGAEMDLQRPERFGQE